MKTNKVYLYNNNHDVISVADYFHKVNDINSLYCFKNHAAREDRVCTKCNKIYLSILFN